MQISEPTTMITDYLLGFFTLILAVRLSKINEGQENSIRLWSGALAAAAIAAFLGGSSHGFALHFRC